MNFKEFRKLTGLSQSKFSKYFHIPLGTVQGWESERHIPPDYVLEMMEKVWEYEQNTQKKKESNNQK